MIGQLEKFFDPLIQPLGFIWLLTAALGLGAVTRRRWRLASALGFIVLLTAVLGNVPFSHYLLATLERSYLAPPLPSLLAGDVVMVPGSYLDYSNHDLYGFHLEPGSTRLVAAVELLRAGKAKALVLSGMGGMAGDGRRWSEAGLARDWLLAWQVAGTPIFSLGVGRNTRDEASLLRALAAKQGWQRIILVTSGFHMRRAEHVYRKLGLNVVPYACDFYGSDKHRPFSPFPKVNGLYNSGLFLHETIGWWVYRLRGWV